MKLKEVTLGVYSSKNNGHEFDAFFRVPVFEKNEFLALRDDFISEFGEDELTRRQVVLNADGSVSQVGEWFLSRFKLHLCSYPMLTMTGMLQEWFDYFKSSFPYNSEMFDNFTEDLPITDSDEYRAYRGYYWKSEEGTWGKNTFRVSQYIQPEDILRGADTSDLAHIVLNSGTGSPFVSSSFIMMLGTYLVEDEGEIIGAGTVTLSGYGEDGTPEGLGATGSALSPVTYLPLSNDPTYLALAETAGEFIDPRELGNDPYDKGGNSGTGGGTGGFNPGGSPVGIPGLPSLSAVDAGFITIFRPTTAQLKNLASYMWNTSLFDLATWQKLFTDPMQAILGLSIVPVSPPSGGTVPVQVGNINTGVMMTKAANQYVSVDCGSIKIEEYWGGYLDYSPYTKAYLYLPYIGTHAIDIDDIMGKTIQVVYHIDILSGACTAFVKCGSSVLYNFNGQCAASIPVTGNDLTNVINGAISVAGSIGAMVATGGLASPLAAPALANTAGTVMSMKPEIEHSGSLGGTGGMLSMQTPYFIITRPRQCKPANQNRYTGYPSYITASLSSLSGFTIVQDLHLENVAATDDELSEIIRLLKEGVIL